MRRLSSRDRLDAVDERRKRKRVAVHWLVRLFEPMGNKSVKSTTENLSSEGFYCLSRKSPSPTRSDYFRHVPLTRRPRCSLRAAAFRSTLPIISPVEMFFTA